MITTEIGTATSWVNQHVRTGLVVDPDSQEQLEEAMMFMHQSPHEAQAMGRRAKQRFDSDFDVRLMANSYINLYQRIIAYKKSSPQSTALKPSGMKIILQGGKKP
jgi:rhamnosyl/mannosyltransferase